MPEALLDLTLPGETQVVVAGDWHGNVSWIARAIPAVTREHPGIRTVLHLGDFGIGSKARDQKFFDSVDYWCQRAGIERIVVTPGNHEDRDYLDAEFAASPGQPVPLSNTVTVLPRGFTFTLAGRAFLSFGGAASVDYQQRTPGFDWFLTEMATDADVERAVSTSKSSPIDVLLTHETVNGGTAATENQLRSNPNGWPAEALYYSRLSRERVTSVWKATAPKLLLHGHMHIADEISLADGTRVISVGRDGQEKNLGLLDLETLDWRWLGGPGASQGIRRSLNVESQYRTRPGDQASTEPDDAS